MSVPIRAVIVDDEPAGRDSVRALLTRYPDVEAVAECATADEALQAVQELQPDLLFLDVQMPGENGIDLLRRLPRELMPLVILVTAYEDYALPAFELQAVDYLLKPYSDGRFHAALARARSRLEADRLERVRRGVLALAQEVEPDATLRTPSAGYLTRLTIRTDTGASIVPVREIVWIEAAGDHARVHLADRWLTVRSTMDRLERRLDPARFVRIHRSTIVNVDWVRELRSTVTEGYLAILRDGTSRPISGRGREQLSRILDFPL